MTIRTLLEELETIENSETKENLNESAIAQTAEYVSNMKNVFNELEGLPAAPERKIGVAPLTTFERFTSGMSNILNSLGMTEAKEEEKKEDEKCDDKEEECKKEEMTEARLEVARNYIKNNLNAKKAVSEQIEEIAQMLVNFDKIS